MTRMMAVSTTPPTTPDRQPTTAPQTVDRMTMAKAVPQEVRAP